MAQDEILIGGSAEFVDGLEVVFQLDREAAGASNAVCQVYRPGQGGALTGDPVFHSDGLVFPLDVSVAGKVTVRVPIAPGSELIDGDAVVVIAQGTGQQGKRWGSNVIAAEVQPARIGSITPDATESGTPTPAPGPAPGPTPIITQVQYRTPRVASQMDSTGRKLTINPNAETSGELVSIGVAFKPKSANPTPPEGFVMVSLQRHQAGEAAGAQALFAKVANGVTPSTYEVDFDVPVSAGAIMQAVRGKLISVTPGPANLASFSNPPTMRGPSYDATDKGSRLDFVSFVDWERVASSPTPGASILAQAIAHGGPSIVASSLGVTQAGATSSPSFTVVDENGDPNGDFYLGVSMLYEVGTSQGVQLEAIEASDVTVVTPPGGNVNPTDGPRPAEIPGYTPGNLPTGSGSNMDELVSPSDPFVYVSDIALGMHDSPGGGIEPIPEPYALSRAHDRFGRSPGAMGTAEVHTQHAQLEPTVGDYRLATLFEWIRDNPGRGLIFCNTGTPPDQQRDDQKHEPYAYPYLNPGGASAYKDLTVYKNFIKHVLQSVYDEFGVQRLYGIEPLNEYNSGYTPDLNQRNTTNKFHHDSTVQAGDRIAATYDAINEAGVSGEGVRLMVGAWEGMSVDYPGSPHRKLVTYLTQIGRTDVLLAMEKTNHSYIYYLNPEKVIQETRDFHAFYDTYDTAQTGKKRRHNTEMGLEYVEVFNANTGQYEWVEGTYRLQDCTDEYSAYVVAFATVSQWALNVHSVCWYPYRRLSYERNRFDANRDTNEFATWRVQTWAAWAKMMGMIKGQIRRAIYYSDDKSLYVEWMDVSGQQMSWHIKKPGSMLL